MPSIHSRPGAWLRRIVAAVVVLVLGGLLTHDTHAGSGDEPHYQMIAHSLAFDLDLDLANNYADRTNLIAGGTLAGDAHAIPGKDGRLRPVLDIGLPLIFSPYFAAAYLAADRAGDVLPPAWLKRAKLTEALILRHLLSLAMMAITAWIAVQLFDIGAGLGARPLAAAGCSLLLVLSPPLMSHSFLFFTEIVSAALALWLFRWVSTPRFAARSPMLLGAVTGLLLLIHARNAGLVAGLAGLAVFSTWRPERPSRALPLFLLGLAAALIVRTAVTWHLWGTLIATPHAQLGASAGAGSVLEAFRRLFGWLFDQEHGLLFYAPIYLLVPAGCAVLWRRDRTLSLQLAAVVALYIGVITVPFINPHGWRGGWSPAARFLVPIVPLLAYPIFAWAIDIRRSFLFIALPLVVLQIALNALLWQYPKLLWNIGDGTSELLTHLGGGTNRLTWLFPSDARMLAPMLFVALMVMAAAWLPVRRLPDADHG